MTKIRYTKERLRSNSRMGIFFVAIGIILFLLSFVTGEWKEISIASIGIGQIGAGIFMFIIYYFEKRRVDKKHSISKKNKISRNKVHKGICWRLKADYTKN
jgi:dipeptide/tripeptide permease